MRKSRSTKLHHHSIYLGHHVHQHRHPRPLPVIVNRWQVITSQESESLLSTSHCTPWQHAPTAPTFTARTIIIIIATVIITSRYRRVRPTESMTCQGVHWGLTLGQHGKEEAKPHHPVRQNHQRTDHWRCWLLASRFSFSITPKPATSWYWAGWLAVCGQTHSVCVPSMRDNYWHYHLPPRAGCGQLSRLPRPSST